MSAGRLTFRAGAGALAEVRRHGFDVGSIGTIAGASGGAKWLVLSQLDRAIATHVLPHLQGPVHLLSSSIGSWRGACFAQADPLAAIERFEQAYVEQSYSEAPDIHEITATSRRILRDVLGENGVNEILANPVLRTHIMTVRSRHFAASDRPVLLGPTLVAAATANLIHRRTLGAFFERALFYDGRDLPPCMDVAGFPLQQVALDRHNLEDAIVASGSIPLVLSGVRDIAGARPGVYRDGGVIDYHLDLPHSSAGRLTLFPHFYDHIVPGWFDKRLGWRKPLPENVEHTILVSPSAEFVAGLPHAKIPDRSDFSRFTPAERVRAWRRCIAECEALAEEFINVIEQDQLAARLEPLC